MTTLRDIWSFLRTHHLKPRYRRRLLLIGGLVVLLIIGGLGARAYSRHQHRAMIPALGSKIKPLSHSELRERKQMLSEYYQSLGATGKVQVGYYSLDPKPGSEASGRRQAFDHRGGWQIEAGADTKVLAASTYKLYIAAYVFHRLEAKQLPWTLTDKSNFDAMIVNSDNGYSQTILTRYGKDTVDKYLKRLGIKPVFAGDAAETTVADLVKLLKMLDAGEGPFANQKLRARLLKDMNEQVYRAGIPAGIKSVDKHAKVADKVGFLSQTNNDAGIVTTKDGHRYILVIMTTGHEQLDFSQIKTIAARTQRIVYGE